MSMPTLHGEMTMREILDALPGARRALFARYHLGGCQSCAFSPDETLAALCRRSDNLPAEEVIAHLLESHLHDQAMWIEPAALQTALASPHPPRLIDIRTREEHEAVTLPDAEFLTQELQQQLFAGPPGQTIVLFDHQGRHALDQCAWFHGHGLRATRALRGGIDAWSREIDPALPRYRLEIE